jgi:hypothetical protein
LKGHDVTKLPVHVEFQDISGADVLLSAFGEELKRESRKRAPRRVQLVAQGWTGPDDDGRALTSFGAVSLMLTDIGLLLWLQQTRRWQSTGKAWTSPEAVQSAVRYYLKGLHVGERPIFDGICSHCGTLLYERLNLSISNKRNGPPRDKDAKPVEDASQPPFLLRWDPSYFVQMLPDVFEHDGRTNRLCIRPDRPELLACPPWKAAGHHRQSHAASSWLYCDHCHERLFSDSREQEFHVPFRDQKSVGKLVARGSTGDADLSAPAGAAPGVPAAQRQEWEARRRKAAKCAPVRSRTFSLDNLVPTPKHELWQNVPQAPFHELQTEDAKGHLACCNLHSALQPHHDERGRVSYALAAGETSFWRRQPRQLSSTLAFMLDRNEGAFYKVKASELEPLRECLQWLRQENPHFRLYWSNAERFHTLYGQLQAVLPRGAADTPVRVQRNRNVESAVATTIQQTLGSEESVLVVIDPGDLPRHWATVDALAEQIGDAEYRAQPVLGPDAQSPAGAVAPVALPPEWGTAMRDAAAALRSETKVTLGDAHLDAKLFPHLHPYGSGSLRAEEGAGGIQHYAKNRLLSLEHGFRHSPVWGFWMLERLIKNDLYFRERQRQATSSAGAGTTPAACSSPAVAQGQATSSAGASATPAACSSPAVGTGTTPAACSSPAVAQGQATSSAEARTTPAARSPPAVARGTKRSSTDAGKHVRMYVYM